MRRTAAQHVGRLWVAFALTAVFVVVEAVTALVTGSLALLSDAAHMATDARRDRARARARSSSPTARRRDGCRTFGLFRLEILASLVNAILLVHRRELRADRSRAPPRSTGDFEVEAGPMLVVAILGLVVNLVVFSMLRTGARDSLAVEGAYLDAMADAAGSVGVIVAAVVILATVGWDPIDPIVAAIIAVWILPRAWRLGASAVRVLLQVAPEHVDLDAIRDELRGAPGCRRRARPARVDAHVGDGRRQRARDGRRRRRRARRARPGARRSSSRHEIAHATIQVEPDDHDRVRRAQLVAETSDDRARRCGCRPPHRAPGCGVAEAHAGGGRQPHAQARG